MIALVIIVTDKFIDRRLQAFLLKVIFQQDSVFERLMPRSAIAGRLPHIYFLSCHHHAEKGCGAQISKAKFANKFSAMRQIVWRASTIF